MSDHYVICLIARQDCTARSAETESAPQPSAASTLEKTVLFDRGNDDMEMTHVADAHNNDDDGASRPSDVTCLFDEHSAAMDMTTMLGSQPSVDDAFDAATPGAGAEPKIDVKSFLKTLLSGDDNGRLSSDADGRLNNHNDTLLTEPPVMSTQCSVPKVDSKDFLTLLSGVAASLPPAATECASRDVTAPSPEVERTRLFSAGENDMSITMCHDVTMRHDVTACHDVTMAVTSE